ncbi:hypothetical protein JCM5296_003188 [Sporobolomyces johnsonii]
MPVPRLPLEVVHLILGHLRQLCAGYPEQLRENGTSAALVCREWRSGGTAVAWDTVAAFSDEVDAVVDHLVQYPSLAVNVKVIALQGDRGLNVVPDRVSGLSAARLFAACPNFRHLDITTCHGGLTAALRSAPATLVTINAWLSTLDSPVDTFLRAITRFNNLRTLAIDLIFSGHRASPSTIPPPCAKIPLRHLDLSLTNMRNDTMHVETLLSSIDPATTRYVHVTYDSPFPSLLPWMSQCPNLSIAVLSISRPCFTSALQQLVATLPSLSHISNFSLFLLCDLSAPDLARRLLNNPSPLPLSAFLDSPLTLPTHLALEGFFFRDRPPLERSLEELKEGRSGRVVGTLICWVLESEEAGAVPVRTFFLNTRQADGTTRWFGFREDVLKSQLPPFRGHYAGQ